MIVFTIENYQGSTNNLIIAIDLDTGTRATSVKSKETTERNLKRNLRIIKK